MYVQTTFTELNYAEQCMEFLWFVSRTFTHKSVGLILYAES